MTALSESTKGALRSADRQLRLTAADDVHGLCAAVRRAAAAIAPVETFYVGLYHGDNILVMPYIFSDGEHLGADTSHFGRDGISHWIRAHERPYRYAFDDGRRCHAGAPVGDGRPSRDIVVVPIFDPDDRSVIGMVNTQSPQPNVFDDAFVVALEWLAQALSLSLHDTGKTASRNLLYRDFPELDSSQANSPLDMLHVATDRLDEVARLIATLQDRAGLFDSDQIKQELARIKDQCRLVHSELAMMAVRAPQPQDTQDVTGVLTAREREIAELIVHESLTNGMISRRLFISEKTVKAHVSNILHKLGIRQRSEIVWLFDPHASRSTRDSTST